MVSRDFKVLALIPARGGSKGIPRKNIKPLCGKPLLQYTAEAALASRFLTKVVLSTEDEEIAEIGRTCGLEVPFLRPAELARDDTPTLPVVQHALHWYAAQGKFFDVLCLLQPTNPCRGTDIIDGCLGLFIKSGADTVITVLPVPTEYNPHWVYFSDELGRLSLSTGEATPIPRRQELPPAFHREGSVYVTGTVSIMERHTLYGHKIIGFPMNPANTVNIDTPEDWQQAERLLQNGVR